MMRVMVIMKANKQSEAGILPGKKLFSDMMKFNEQLVKAGVLLAADGLHPSSRGKRVKFSDGKRTVMDGPFPEPEKLVAGFWLWKVKSMDEALDWIKRLPEMPEGEGEIEIREIMEPEDLGAAFTPEMKEQQERLMEAMATNAKCS